MSQVSNNAEEDRPITKLRRVESKELPLVKFSSRSTRMQQIRIGAQFTDAAKEAHILSLRREIDVMRNYIEKIHNDSIRSGLDYAPMVVDDGPASNFLEDALETHMITSSPWGDQQNASQFNEVEQGYLSQLQQQQTFIEGQADELKKTKEGIEMLSQQIQELKIGQNTFKKEVSEKHDEILALRRQCLSPEQLPTTDRISLQTRPPVRRRKCKYALNFPVLPSIPQHGSESVRPQPLPTNDMETQPPLPPPSQQPVNDMEAQPLPPPSHQPLPFTDAIPQPQPPPSHPPPANNSLPTSNPPFRPSTARSGSSQIPPSTSRTEFDLSNPSGVTAAVSTLTALLQAMGTVGGDRRRKHREGSSFQRSDVKHSQENQMSSEEVSDWRRLIRHIWRRAYGTEKHADFSTYQPASPAIVDSYKRGVGPGPGDELVLDFGRGWGKSTWNKVVLKNLLEQARLEQRERGLTDVSDDYINAILWSQLKQAQESYAKCRPRVIGDRLETGEEVVERVRDSVADEYYRKGSRSRKERKHAERLGIVKHAILVKTHTGAVDLPTWTYFKDLLERLGVNGMSSEDSSTTTTVKGIRQEVFMVKLCEWRAKEVDGYLSTIDVGGSIAKLPGPGPKKALRVPTTEIGEYPAVPNLPRCLYDAEWLSERSWVELDQLQVSEEAFHLLTVATEHQG